VRLTKHHGLGNDFLVLLDLDGTTPIDADLARRVCDRRRGVGADGLIRVGPGVTMELLNADGSRAEMSGNGIRCLAQAVARSRGADDLELDVSTDAGPRHVSLHGDVASVDMGAAADLDDPAERDPSALKSATISMGNPNEVRLYGDRAALDAAADGFTMTDRNVLFVVAGPGPDELTARVVERGAGETEACGTGACAAVFASARWGVVGSDVTVHMPGGDVHVALGADAVTLTGPVEFVADVEIPWR
jgi:diaminopimelate epimerase